MKNNIILLQYGNTKTYLIKGEKGNLLIDTDIYGTLNEFFKTIKQANIKVSDINYVTATHYHPDHIGLISELMDLNVKLLLVDNQLNSIHFSDEIFKRNSNNRYKPINENNALIITTIKSRSFLKSLGINGEIIKTNSHSTDSIAVILDDGNCFVGDLEPYEYIKAYPNNLTLTKDWNNILAYNPKVIHFSHNIDKIIDKE